MEEKAQVPLEYLALIVGVIAIATVAALYIKNAASTAGDAVAEEV